MTEPAAQQILVQIESLSAECKRSFRRKDYSRCIEDTEKVLALWSDADPAVREHARKAVRPALKFGCLACFKAKNVERGMALYEEALSTKKTFWDLGICVAGQLDRLQQKEKLAVVLNDLRSWATQNPKHRPQLDAFLKSTGNVDAPRPKPVVQQIKSTHFTDRPRNQPGNESTLWVKALPRVAFVPTSGRFSIVVNPKAACSTLKFNIWRHEYETGATKSRPPVGNTGIHRKENTAIHKVSMEQMESALLGKPIFSVVRNPYSRTLSAYLDKIVGTKNGRARILLCMGRVEDAPVSFAEFVEFISTQHSQEMDPHYAPQTFLMQIGYLPYARIGCVERMEESVSAIIADGYGVAPKATGEFRPHRTGASSLIAQYYTDELAAKIADRFRLDFELLGYSTALADVHLPPRRLEQAAQADRRLTETVLRPMLRAAVAEQSEDFRAALKILSAIASDDPELDATKARVLMRLKRAREAVGLLESAVARAPNLTQCWSLLAKCLLTLRRTKEAVQAADTAAFITPVEEVLRRAMDIANEAGDREKARAYRDRIEAIDVLLSDRRSARRQRKKKTRRVRPARREPSRRTGGLLPAFSLRQAAERFLRVIPGR